MVGLVLSSWKNRYLLENLDAYLDLAPSRLLLKADATRQPGRRAPVKVYKLEQRLGVADRAAMVAYYCEGHSSRETARRFGLGKTAVLRLLREEGVNPRAPYDTRIEHIEAGALDLLRGAGSRQSQLSTVTSRGVGRASS